jgi:hypothetical protein
MDYGLLMGRVCFGRAIYITTRDLKASPDESTTVNASFSALEITPGLKFKMPWNKLERCHALHRRLQAANNATWVDDPKVLACMPFLAECNSQVNPFIYMNGGSKEQAW